MKKLNTILPSVLLTVLASTHAIAAEKSHYQAMHKQLNIMSNIIESSVQPSNNRDGSRITNINSTYLKGQGIVFTINSNSRGNQWGNYNFNFVMPDLPPIAPMPPKAPVVSTGNEEFDQQVNVTVERSMREAERAYEIAVESFEHNREGFRDLRDEQRDLAYEMRDVERELRDIEYQLKRADAEDKKELKAEMNALTKQQAKLSANQKQFQEKSAALQKKKQAQQAEKEKARATYYQGLQASLAETLCLYGNGLKALPKNEHVSVILKSAGEKEGRRYKDNILVFSKSDISACSMDKINVAKLLEKGQSYQF
jgi:hypothetical protein